MREREKNDSLIIDIFKMSLFLILILIITMITGCDSYNTDAIDDAAPHHDKVVLEALAGTTTIIDFKSALIIHGEVGVTINSEPKYGRLENLFGELFKYTPHEEVKKATEVLEFAVFGSGNSYLFTDSISIEIVETLSDTCSFVAIEDKYQITTYGEVILDVLSNDMICDNNVQLAIIKNPTNAEVSIQGNKIRYVPSSSEEYEEFVYSISRQDSSTISAALVSVSWVADTCEPTAVRDEFEMISYNDLLIDVTANDVLCDDNIVISIIEKPNGGIASIKGRKIEYLPYRSYQTDSLVYRISRQDGSEASSATVTIVTAVDICDTIIATDDDLVLSDNHVLWNGYGFNILSNDLFCTDIYMEIIEPPVGQASFTGDNILYYIPPKDTTITSDIMIYKLHYLANDDIFDLATVTIRGF